MTSRRCALGDEIHPSPNRIRFHIGSEGLRDFDSAHQICWDRIKGYLPACIFRRPNALSIDRRRAKARFRSTNQDVTPFTLVALDDDSRNALGSLRSVWIREASDLIGSDEVY